jgi:hypothetical protein
MSHRPDPRCRKPRLVVRVVDASDHVTGPIDLGVEAVEERADALKALEDDGCWTHGALLSS